MEVRIQTDPRAQEIADLLGADRQQQFETTRTLSWNANPWCSCERGCSDATRLPDDKAEALITALADERQKNSPGSRGAQTRA